MQVLEAQKSRGIAWLQRVQAAREARLHQNSEGSK